MKSQVFGDKSHSITRASCSTPFPKTDATQSTATSGSPLDAVGIKAEVDGLVGEHLAESVCRHQEDIAALFKAISEQEGRH